MSDTAGLRSDGYVVGLDLGQASDFSALVVNEKHVTNTWPSIVHHRIVHLHRFQLGTPYPDIIEAVRKVMAQMHNRPHKPVLVVDATGVGRPVIDTMKERGLSPIGVTITGGVDVNEKAHDDVRCPKRLLASTMQVALQTGRIKIAERMPHTGTLIKELQAFKVRINVATGAETFEAWREQDHDDLVLATALAVWRAEYQPKHGAYDESLSWVSDDATGVNDGFVGHMYSR